MFKLWCELGIRFVLTLVFLYQAGETASDHKGKQQNDFAKGNG